MVFTVVTAHFPELVGEGQLVHSIFHDLFSRGLTAVDGALVPVPNIGGSWTTHLGDDFLKFIAPPL
jgi:hypothetical protein